MNDFIPTTPGLQVTDLYLLYKNLFSAQAQVALEKEKTTSLTGVKLFSIIVKDQKDIPEAVVKLATVIDELARKEFIVRPMTALSSIELTETGVDMGYCVVSFLELTPEGQTYADNAYYDLTLEYKPEESPK